MNRASNTQQMESRAAWSDDELDLGARMTGDLDCLDDFARELGRRYQTGPGGGSTGAPLPQRINANPATVEKDIAKLVLALVDLVREVVERQALRRVNGGSLTEDQIERMGDTFLRLDRKMAELKAAFGLADEDLRLSLGPIGDLL